MQVWYGSEQVPARLTDPRDAGTVVTVGIFDGVHRGHQAILARVVERARRMARPGGERPMAVAVTFDPVEVADNMKKYGGFIPGIRAGKPTARYLSYVLNRITLPGALYLGVISMIPLVALILFNANQNFPFGGASLLIVVGVGLDTLKQINAQLQQRNYEGLLR